MGLYTHELNIHQQLVLINFSSSVHEKIEAGKRSIEDDLKDLVKLYSWEQETYRAASIDKFKKARQKIFRLLQQFNNVCTALFT